MSVHTLQPSRQDGCSSVRSVDKRSSLERICSQRAAKQPKSRHPWLTPSSIMLHNDAVPSSICERLASGAWSARSIECPPAQLSYTRRQNSKAESHNGHKKYVTACFVEFPDKHPIGITYNTGTIIMKCACIDQICTIITNCGERSRTDKIQQIPTDNN
mmetsp:Transcript_23135/g.54585  ORF Transcript_23135/g.54585 Transcript_23135/m.54585 type:complete len:159 (+) Transcript_23135:173-649(+)